MKNKDCGDMSKSRGDGNTKKQDHGVGKEEEIRETRGKKLLQRHRERQEGRKKGKEDHNVRGRGDVEKMKRS